MSKQDGLRFGVAGALAGMAASAFYAAFAHAVIERAFWLYALNAVLIALATHLAFHGACRLRRLPRPQLPTMASLFAAAALTAGALVMLAIRPSAMSGRYLLLMLVVNAVLVASAAERASTFKARWGHSSR